MSEVKVNKISPRIDCGTVTVGDAGDSVTVTAGVPVTVNGDLKSNALKAVDGGSIISQCGTTITLGASGDTITLACGATQSGFGRSGSVNWDTTAKTASFTAVSGNGYFINTTGGAITMTLPATPSAGDIVSVKDYAYTFATNNLTVGRNSSPVGGGTSYDPVFSTNGASLTFVYVDGTKGWLVTSDTTNILSATNTFVSATGGSITTSGDYKIHTFTGPGTFCVSAAAGPVAVVDYMVVAGGGGRGSCNYYGGGGAGGFRESHSVPVSGCYTASPLASSTSIPVSVSAYPIQVGAGGAVNPGAPGSIGTPSIALGITSAGGGGGARGNRGPLCNSDGGSGGGAAHDGGDGLGTGGSGNTPPVSPPQGNPGGNTIFPAGRGAGGGGATASGSNGVPANGGNGGAGATTSISSSPVTYSKGGGGQDAPDIAAAPANSGDGGGTSAGGSGVVIIRYKYQ